MNLKCGYFTVGGIMCGSLVGIFVGALAVNASLGYMILLLGAWGLCLYITSRSLMDDARREETVLNQPAEEFDDPDELPPLYWEGYDRGYEDALESILSDAEVVSKTATEINSSAGDYSLSIMDFQHLYYDALQAALRLGDQIGQAYRLCDASAWDADELAVTWGNGVLYDADQEWTERKELVQMGLLKPELALAWKFDLPAESEADLAEIRKNYMPELKDLEG